MKTPCMKCGKGYGSDYDGLCTDCRGRTAWEQRVKNGELVKVPGNHPVTQAWKGRDMNKLTALIEAAKEATPGPWFNGDFSDDFGDNPVTVYATKPELLAKGQSSIWPDGLSKILVADTNEGIYPVADATFIALANPATILELCALLEKAEMALDGCLARLYGELYPNHPETLEVEEALAAIKQWKEQT